MCTLHQDEVLHKFCKVSSASPVNRWKITKGDKRSSREKKKCLKRKGMFSSQEKITLSDEE